MSMMELNVYDVSVQKRILRCIFVAWLSLNLKVAYYIQFFFFLYSLKEQSCCGKLYSQNKSNNLLTLFTLPDKWSKMAISPIREKSKIKLLFVYAYILITLQIYGANFFLNYFSMFNFLFSKLGNISDINWFMTWFHLEFIGKLLEFKVAYVVRFIYKLIQVFYIQWIKNLKHQIFFIFEI